ncbi:MAG: hypothetical protein M1820_010424 [Bogoriella megaspora]|nr:MAG: hypothetical protein M1820_010424 [Bogoriella megaspora]
MASSSLAIACAAVLLAVTLVCLNGSEYFAFIRNRRRTGCYMARKYPHSEPFLGYDLYRKRRRALANGDTQDLYTSDFNRLGKTWQETFLGQRIINTMDAVNHQYIHALGFEDFGKSPQRAKLSAQVLGNGIFIAEGSQWKHSRSIIKPIFAKAEVENMTMMAKHVDRFLALVPRDSSDFDIQPMLKKLFLDFSTEFLFGESVNAQTPEGAATGENFLRSLDETLLGWNKRRQAGLLSFRYTFDKSWAKAYTQLYSFIDARVNRALELTSCSANGKVESRIRNQPGRYVLLHELVKDNQDPISLRFELINVFLPSRDTTAALLSNTFFQLARHPKYWKQLRESALSLPINPADPSSLSFSTLKSLLPFRYVIYETLRTLGPAGRIFRTARRDTTLPRGGGPDGRAPVFVARGTTVCSLTYHIHHDRDIWGNDADDFRPERWEEGPKGGWEFVPFLGGPRICPAQQQVLIQATYLLLRMVSEFEWIENRDEIWEYVELQRMAVESRRGVKIALGSTAVI